MNLSKTLNKINHSLLKANSYSGRSPKLIQGCLSNRFQRTCGRDHLQISLLILSEFNRINELLFPQKSSDYLWFSDGLRGNRS